MRAPALFALDRADLLATLADELDAFTYAPSKGRAFAITDPKSRLIYALPFRDRVVQHWLMERMMPAMERWFAPQSYACRVGKGSHRCLERAIELTRHKRFVLRIDIRKFFPSIDHAILRALLEPFTGAHLPSVGPMPHCAKQNGIGWLCDAFLEQRVECERVAWYFPGDTLFTPFDRPHGLPIGSLTSQIWANAFLTPIDHLIASKLRIGTFVRYCDDLLLFDDDKGRLQDALSAIEQRASSLRLRLHAGKTRLHRSTDPIRHGPAREGRAPLRFVTAPPANAGIQRIRWLFGVKRGLSPSSHSRECGNPMSLPMIIVAYISNQARMVQSWFAVNPSNRWDRCSQIRFTRLLVTPV